MASATSVADHRRRPSERPSGTRRRTLVAIAATIAALALAACATVPGRSSRTDERDIAAGTFELKLIGEQTLDHALQFGGTTVGGLSGIDYDPTADLYYLISDDRSEFAPARFYTARLTIDGRGFHDASLQSIVTLLQPDGTPYPVDASDSESIRFDPRTRSLWWTSEGARKIGRGSRADRTRLIDPFIRRAGLDGRYLGEVPLAPMFRVTTEARGPRDNLVFEGSTLTPDGQSLWVSMEGPLLQDGPPPTMRDGAWSRFSRYDRRSLPDGDFGRLALQVAYRIGPIPSERALTSLYAQNGVSELLALDATHLLVLERALVLGAGWRIRLFEADVSRATDVAKMDTLADASDGALRFVPTTGRLVLDFDTLGIRIDNLEGMCFGPLLANGHRTLVLVSDDNFNPGQTTQFIALEIVPR